MNRILLKLLLTEFFVVCLGFSFAQVNADFTADQTSDCGSFTVNFTNTSTGTGTLTYQWNFGDGATSTEKNPGHTYLNPGTYTVSLTTSNTGSSDTETKTNYITVFAEPTAEFTQNDTAGCSDDFTVSFTDQSAPAGSFASWLWDFGDGEQGTQQNPQHTYTAPGIYTVSFFATDTNGCMGPKIKNSLITVLDSIVAEFTLSNNFSCIAPFTLNFTNTTSGSGLFYQWNFGDPASGTNDTSTLKNPPPHIYNSFGDYTITLIVTNSIGCSDTATKVFSLQSFSADFNVENDDTAGCAPFSAKFKANNPTANSFTWTFQGGSPASSNNSSPTINYNAAGSYSVTLIATNSQNCSDTVTVDDFITVFPLPSVAISANDSSSCAVPFNVDFSPVTSADTAWSWTFTGGTPANSTDSNPTITYGAAGNYNVSLTVTDSNGCSKTTTVNNFIKITFPDAQFNAVPPVTKGCKPLTVNFKDVSTSSPPADPWQWDFGDPLSGANNTSILQNPSHTYNDTGIFTVTLIIKNAEGCTDTNIKPAFVMVGQIPNVDYAPKNDSGCHPFTVTFTNLSSSFTDEWQWDFTNGITSYASTSFSPTQTFSDTGAFDVMLTAFHHGCPATITVLDSIYVKPAKPIFTPSSTAFCEKNTPYEVTFSDASIGADEYTWDFGDGTAFENTPVPNPHTYASPGFYTVWLKVKNTSTQCEDSTSTLISISDIDVSFEVDTISGCQPVQISFSDSSTANSSIAFLTWLFGDGINTIAGAQTDTIKNTSNTSGIFSNPTHTYNNSGFYDVSLIITDQLGCMDTLSLDDFIDVKPLPDGGFDADTTNGCAPLEINFSDTTNSNSTIEKWNWNFGDSQTDTLQNPVHTFVNPQQYTVTLIVTDTFQCKDTIVKTSYINVTFPFTNFSVTDTICNFTAPTFNNSSTPASDLTYVWDFGDGTPTDNSTTPNHVFSVNSDSTISLNIILTATDSNGCDSVLSKPIVISIPVANFVAGAQNDSCPPFAATFMDASFAAAGFQSWFWDFGDGGTIQKPTAGATHTYQTAGIYNVEMILTDKKGCKDTMQIDSLIKVSGPGGTFTITSDVKKCYSTVQFSATTQNANSMIWDFSDGIVDSVSGNNVTHTYTTNGSFTPILSLRDTDNCKVDIFPYNINVAIAVIDDFISSDTDNVYPATNIVFAGSSNSPSTIVLWEWDFGDGSSVQSTAALPQKHKYDKPGEYFVALKVTDADSCTAFVKYKVTIIEGIELATIFTPNGDGKNDFFFIPNGGMKEHYIVILNRWGEKIYENRAQEIQWYGKNFSGAEAPDGTYFYVLESTRENGEVIVNKNYITLTR